jgi:hypothetical protein
MAFSINRRRPQQPETATAAPEAVEQQLLDAEAARDALLAEQGQLRETLAAHQRQREQILSSDGELSQAVELDRANYTLKLRLEQVERQLPACVTAVYQAQAAVHEAAWLAMWPLLRDTELQLAAAIGSLFRELKLARAVHAEAARAGFGPRLREFVTIPPDSPMSDYSLRGYVKAAGRGRQPVVVAADFTATEPEEPVELPPDPHFVPKRPDFAIIRAISLLAPPRAIRIIHGPTQVRNLNVGINRVFAGEQHVFPARGAATLVAMGVAEYIDDPAITVETLVATA